MLLAPGKWTGKGSFRPVDVASGTSFEVDFTLSEDDGALIEGGADRTRARRRGAHRVDRRR